MKRLFSKKIFFSIFLIFSNIYGMFYRPMDLQSYLREVSNQGTFNNGFSFTPLEPRCNTRPVKKETKPKSPEALEYDKYLKQLQDAIDKNLKKDKSIESFDDQIKKKYIEVIQKDFAVAEIYFKKSQTEKELAMLLGRIQDLNQAKEELDKLYNDLRLYIDEAYIKPKTSTFTSTSTSTVKSNPPVGGICMDPVRAQFPEIREGYTYTTKDVSVIEQNLLIQKDNITKIKSRDLEGSNSALELVIAQSFNELATDCLGKGSTQDSIKFAQIGETILQVFYGAAKGTGKGMLKTALGTVSAVTHSWDTVVGLKHLNDFVGTAIAYSVVHPVETGGVVLNKLQEFKEKYSKFTPEQQAEFCFEIATEAYFAFCVFEKGISAVKNSEYLASFLNKLKASIKFDSKSQTAQALVDATKSAADRLEVEGSAQGAKDATGTVATEVKAAEAVVQEVKGAVKPAEETATSFVGAQVVQESGVVVGRIKSTKLFKKDHIFSKPHINDGILNLSKIEGTVDMKKDDILNMFMNIINESIDQKLLKNEDNRILTNINGCDVQIKFFVQNGEITNGADGYIGHSNKPCQNTLLYNYETKTFTVRDDFVKTNPKPLEKTVLLKKKHSLEEKVKEEKPIKKLKSDAIECKQPVAKLAQNALELHKINPLDLKKTLTLKQALVSKVKEYVHKTKAYLGKKASAAKRYILNKIKRTPVAALKFVGATAQIVTQAGIQVASQVLVDKATKLLPGRPAEQHYYVPDPVALQYREPDFGHRDPLEHFNNDPVARLKRDPSDLYKEPIQTIGLNLGSNPSSFTFNPLTRPSFRVNPFTHEPE